MKILLLGRNGQVGRELQRTLAPLGELIALERRSSDFCGDLSRHDDLAETVRSVRPDVIVNAAAWTGVDAAENEPEAARIVNALAPGVLAHEAAALGALLVHYSTDYVFDGSGSRPWSESDRTAPLNVYGRTKLEGEQLVQAACPLHLVLRTGWVYSAHGNNFIRTMLRLDGERETVTVVDDQFGAPTGADLLADVTARAISKLKETPGLAGLYHVAAQGETTWFLYAKHAIAQAERASTAIKIIAKEVLPVASADFPLPAQRPKNSRLDSGKIQAAFGLALPHWQEGVSRAVGQMLLRCSLNAQ